MDSGWIDKWVDESHLELLRLLARGSETFSKCFPGGSVVKNLPANEMWFSEVGAVPQPENRII